MRIYCRSLPEDHRYRTAALKALKIGFGGIASAARVSGMSGRTIYTGICEGGATGNGDPAFPQHPSGDEKRSRQPERGRPKVTECQAGKEETLDSIVETHSAGSPTDESVCWTDHKPLQLAKALLHCGYAIGRNTAVKLLDRAGFHRRSFHKELITSHVDPYERDQQGVATSTPCIGRPASAASRSCASIPGKRSCSVTCIVARGATAPISGAHMITIFATSPAVSWCPVALATTSRSSLRGPGNLA